MRLPTMTPLLSMLHRVPPAAMMLDATAGMEMASALHTSVSDVGTTLAFSDQGNNLAGIFFQVSLLPYLGFLYFLGYEKNRVPKSAMFGTQFLLLFVVSTVVTGIVTKGTYTSSLANVDWLHGGAETLLTTSNLFLGFGLAGALSTGKLEAADAQVPAWPRIAAAGLALAVFGSAFAGPALGLGAHDALLFGAGNLPADLLSGFPLHAEPENALSIPTWAIHFSSVFEYLFAMGMMWQFAALTGNERFKGMTWGMLPLHASGVAACTYHFFYNNPDLAFLVTLQAGLTVCIAALRLALSNGWTLSELNPFSKEDEPTAAEAEAQVQAQAQALPAAAPYGGAAVLPNAAKLVLLTAAASFATKRRGTVQEWSWWAWWWGGVEGGIVHGGAKRSAAGAACQGQPRNPAPAPASAPASAEPPHPHARPMWCHAAPCGLPVSPAPHASCSHPKSRLTPAAAIPPHQIRRAGSRWLPLPGAGPARGGERARRRPHCRDSARRSRVALQQALAGLNCRGAPGTPPSTPPGTPPGMPPGMPPGQRVVARAAVRRGVRVGPTCL